MSRDERQSRIVGQLAPLKSKKRPPHIEQIEEAVRRAKGGTSHDHR